MFVKIFLFFLLVNIFLNVMAGYASDLGDPVTAAAIDNSTLNPQFYNTTTGHLIGNLTSVSNVTIANNTGSGNLLNPIIDVADWAVFTGQFILDIMTAQYILDVFDSFTSSIGITFPSEVIIGMQILMGFANAFFIIYIITGRSIPSFT